jgi:apolipoprotein N-acyltransferase
MEFPQPTRMMQPREAKLLALGLGALAATGFQPLGLWPVAMLAMAGFIALLSRTADWRQAAVLGWLFGLAHFTTGNNWIATAFTYQAEMPAALGWVAVPLLSVYLAVYPAITAALARLMAPADRDWGLVLAVAASWIVGEWLRSWVFTGFAWNPFGIILLGGMHSPGLAALSPWLGTYALSGFAVLLSGALLVGWRRKARLPLAVGLAALVAIMLLPAGEGRDGSLALTLVQPDIRQDRLNDPALFEEHFARTARLSLPRKDGERRLVLWPESGIPDYLREGYPQGYYDQMTANGDPAYARARIGRVIGSGGLLMTGAVDLEIAGGRAVGAYNAVTVIDHSGAIRGGYAKAHLVPYGEYLALRWLLEPLGAARLVAGSIDFLPGPGPRTLDLGSWGKAGVQICYEIIFSGQVVDRAHRPDFIFNPSNDGWFGSWGPPQHLAQARLRAIEEGLPVLRATTTGISAVIDARGVVRESIGRLAPGRIDGLVPPAASPTLFSRLGNILPLAWAMLLAFGALVATRRGHR